MPGTVRLEDVYEPIRRELEAVRRTLGEQLRSSEPAVDEICGYVLSSRGKLLRPALFFLSLRSLGRADLSPELIRTASSIELIHIASLIHDDVIDGSPIRRGKESLWKRFGLERAVVFVDFIFSKALRMLSGVGRPEVWGALAEAVEEMCEGEILQINLRGQPDVHEPDCIRISLKKTASLFSTACSLGALMGEGGEEEIKRLGEFGKLFGLAYQMADDLTDLEAEDAVVNEPTLPSVEGAEAAASRIEQYLREARNKIAFLKPSPHRDSIRGLIDWLAHRVRAKMKALGDGVG